MSFLAKLEIYRAVFGSTAMLHAGRAFLSSGPVEVAFKPPLGLPHPLHVRLKTSDLSTYVKIFLEREYDFELAAEPRVIVDAGANIGLASVWYANRYPRARIVALEPEPSNFRMLCVNVARYPAIVPLQTALWRSAGDVAVVDPGLGHWAFRTEEPGAAAPGSAAARALSVDALMRAHGIDRIDLLKVDIEGAEREVFADPSEWIGRVNSIAIELHDRMRPGCSRAVFAATGDFAHEAWRGENLLLARTPPAHGSSSPT
jgi:FkbM family methyltransferase